MTVATNIDAYGHVIRDMQREAVAPDEVLAGGR
jgi:hypothetical protein